MCTRPREVVQKAALPDGADYLVARHWLAQVERVVRATWWVVAWEEQELPKPLSEFATSHAATQRRHPQTSHQVLLRVTKSTQPSVCYSKVRVLHLLRLYNLIYYLKWLLVLTKLHKTKYVFFLDRSITLLIMKVREQKKLQQQRNRLVSPDESSASARFNK